MKYTIRRRAFCTNLLAGLAVPSLAWSQTDSSLEIGVLPNLSARILLAQYQPMREFLTREMKRTVHVSTAPNWNTFHERTMALEYDLIVTAANLARLAQLDRGYTPLLSYAPYIKGMVASAIARPIKAISELRGQTLVLSNPQSLVTLRGMQWLAENGLQRHQHFKTINVPTDDSVGSVVVRGDAFAAMLSGGEYRAIPEAVKAQLQILTVFTEVPGFVVMANPKLPALQARAIRENLLRFASGTAEGKAFFASSGFSDIREPEAGLMESLDTYIEATRMVMAPAA